MPETCSFEEEVRRAMVWRRDEKKLLGLLMVCSRQGWPVQNIYGSHPNTLQGGVRVVQSNGDKTYYLSERTPKGRRWNRSVAGAGTWKTKERKAGKPIKDEHGVTAGRRKTFYFEEPGQKYPTCWRMYEYEHEDRKVSTVLCAIFQSSETASGTPDTNNKIGENSDSHIPMNQQSPIVHGHDANVHGDGPNVHGFGPDVPLYLPSPNWDLCFSCQQDAPFPGSNLCFDCHCIRNATS